jgi:flagellin-like protein
MRSVLSKRGISPIVSTILLIAIVVILAVIIFLWARGFVAEKAQKFGRAVELSCGDVNFESGVFCDAGNCVLDIINRGDIPLYGFEVKELGSGSVIVKETSTGTVSIGDSVSVPLQGDLSGTELLIVPVILGETGSGKVAHTCPDHLGFGTSVP